MRRSSMTVILAAAAFAAALVACERESRENSAESAAEKGQVVADDGGAATDPGQAAQAQLDAAFVGKFTPPYPDGFVEEGGHLDQAGGGEVSVIYGRWTRGTSARALMLVLRTVGPEVSDAQGRRLMRSQIVQAFPMPSPRAREHIFLENCRSPEYSEADANIYANASPSGRGVTHPPSAAWRLDRATGRLLPVDASRVTCEFDDME